MTQLGQKEQAVHDLVDVVRRSVRAVDAKSAEMVSSNGVTVRSLLIDVGGETQPPGAHALSTGA